MLSLIMIVCARTCTPLQPVRYLLHGRASTAGDSNSSSSSSSSSYCIGIAGGLASVLHCTPPLWQLSNSTSNSSNSNSSSSSDMVTRLTPGPSPRTLMAMHDDGTLVLHAPDSSSNSNITAATATESLPTAAGARGSSAVWRLHAGPPPAAVALQCDPPLSPPKGPSALPPARPLCFAVLLLQDNCSAVQWQQQKAAVVVGYSNGAVAAFSVGYGRNSLSTAASTAARATVS
jgi:hypothetical protein